MVVRLRAFSSSSTNLARRGRALTGLLRPPLPKKRKLGLSMQTGETNRYAQPASNTSDRNFAPPFVFDSNMVGHQVAHRQCTTLVA